MKTNIEIDAIDKRLIELLQQDATQSVQALSEQVGLSNNPCWRRIKRLEEVGVILGRVAVVDPAVLGLSTTVYVQIKIKSHSQDWLENFSKALAKIPEIVECHRMAGETDYLLKVLVRDLPHYDDVYQRFISLVPGLESVSSNFSMEQLKQSSVVPTST